MSNQVKVYISISLNNKILSEKEKLKKIEASKVKSRRRVITRVIASRSLAGKLK